MLHRPTRLLFEIYLRAAADPSRLTMFDLSARLAHVCDVPEWAAGSGYEVPAPRPVERRIDYERLTSIKCN
jgi:hypothetical protein